jgi:hypothetical protein
LSLAQKNKVDVDIGLDFMGKTKESSLLDKVDEVTYFKFLALVNLCEYILEIVVLSIPRTGSYYHKMCE